MGKPLIDSNCYIADNVPEALLNVTLVASYLLFASVKGHLQAQDLKKLLQDPPEKSRRALYYSIRSATNQST